MKRNSISKTELQAIAEAFADYSAANWEKGHFYLCRGRRGRIAFAKGYAMFCVKSGWLHIVGEKREGYICIQSSHEKPSLSGIAHLITGIARGMGIIGAIRLGLGYMRSGIAINILLKKESCIRIRMVVVRKEHQGKGYMRRLVNIAAEIAAKKNVPCVVSTDSLEKAKKYEHLGFMLFRKSHLSENASEYDMIMRPQPISAIVPS